MPSYDRGLPRQLRALFTRTARGCIRTRCNRTSGIAARFVCGSLGEGGSSLSHAGYSWLSWCTGWAHRNSAGRRRKGRRASRRRIWISAKRIRVGFVALNEDGNRENRPSAPAANDPGMTDVCELICLRCGKLHNGRRQFDIPGIKKILSINSLI